MLKIRRKSNMRNGNRKQKQVCAFSHNFHRDTYCSIKRGIFVLTDILNSCIKFLWVSFNAKYLLAKASTYHGYI